ncbi:polysaccharide deacetylase family protein [Chitiniphilus purpureus]|uniref:Polysaccharide deacetylase family protein n=1 Tax=Chitiniphilus purpureus TaxID=2981137 RepID=A0ABY6DPP5_9NEIS|nr:carbohydrate-binding protein [Chitiniphilus sp. CD1]UXY16335.1 polysaccharide deacetylase family protein [Chitiniphilus sp. CD1]
MTTTRSRCVALAALLLAGASGAASLPAWQDGSAYAAGQIVQHQGSRYQARIAHTAWQGAGWNPAHAASLWQRLGNCVTAAGDLCNPPRAGSVHPTTWAGGARGAYSLVHDDLCAYITDGQLQHAAPELNKRGLKAAFAIISDNCAPYHWDAARAFLAQGHEIVSHSRTHQNSNSPGWNSETEIAGSAAAIAAALDGYVPTFFVWPSDIAPDAPLAYLKTQPNYLGGRAANRVDEQGNIQYGQAAGVNPADFADPYAIKWDVFTQSGIWSLYPQGSEILNLHVDAAIDQGGWALRTAHGVEDSSWETIPLARYIGHLDHVKAKVDSGELWMAPPSAVIRYRFARDACAPQLVDGATIRFADSADCRRYATRLTLEFTSDKPAVTVKASQAGTALPVTRLAADRYRIDAETARGDVALTLY